MARPRLRGAVRQAHHAAYLIPDNVYYSDAFAVYAQRIYDPGQHQALPDKRQTDSVEGCHAELRHYLARLARRSRCFSRCLDAIRHAIKIFVFVWNRRQWFKRDYPIYPAHLPDFVYP